MRQQPLESPRQRNLRRSAGISVVRGAVARFLDLIERRLVEPHRRARQRRLQLDLMAGLSRRTLADVGLLRADVQAVAWGVVPSRQIGAGRAAAVGACCEDWPRACTCGPRRPRRSQARELPEAA